MSPNTWTSHRSGAGAGADRGNSKSCALTAVVLVTVVAAACASPEPTGPLVVEATPTPIVVTATPSPTPTETPAPTPPPPDKGKRPYSLVPPSSGYLFVHLGSGTEPSVNVDGPFSTFGISFSRARVSVQLRRAEAFEGNLTTQTSLSVLNTDEQPRSSGLSAPRATSRPARSRKSRPRAVPPCGRGRLEAELWLQFDGSVPRVYGPFDSSGSVEAAEVRVWVYGHVQGEEGSAIFSHPRVPVYSPDHGTVEFTLEGDAVAVARRDVRAEKAGLLPADNQNLYGCATG